MSVTFIAFEIDVARSQGVARTNAERLRQQGRQALDPENPHALAKAGPTEAPAGFDNLTNGFTEQGPPFEELNENNVIALRLVQRQPLHLRGDRNDQGWPRPDVQRPELPGMPSERGHRRSEPGSEAPHGLPQERRLLRIARWLADPVARDASRAGRAGASGRRDPGAADLDEHPRKRFRGSDREQHISGDPRRPAGRNARYAGECPRTGVRRHERAGRFGWKSQHASLVVRRDAERDGDHHTAAA